MVRCASPECDLNRENTGGLGIIERPEIKIPIAKTPFKPKLWAYVSIQMLRYEIRYTQYIVPSVATKPSPYRHAPAIGASCRAARKARIWRPPKKGYIHPFMAVAAKRACSWFFPGHRAAIPKIIGCLSGGSLGLSHRAKGLVAQCGRWIRQCGNEQPR